MQADGEVGPSREIGFTMRNPVKKKKVRTNSFQDRDTGKARGVR